MFNNKNYAIMKNLKNYVSNEAVEIIVADTKRWSIGLYEHNTQKMTVYCVARIANTMIQPSFEFYADKEEALKRFNHIYNIVKDDQE